MESGQDTHFMITCSEVCNLPEVTSHPISELDWLYAPLILYIPNVGWTDNSSPVVSLPYREAS